LPLKKLRRKIKRLRAKAMGLTVREYEELQRRKRAKEKQEKLKFELWKIEQKYREKRRRAREPRGDGFLRALRDIGESIVDVGATVSENVEREFFGLPPRRRRRKRRRKR